MVGLTIYGVTEPRQHVDVDEAGGDEAEVNDEGVGDEEDEDKNAAVNPHDAGKWFAVTIIIITLFTQGILIGINAVLHEGPESIYCQVDNGRCGLMPCHEARLL